MPLAHPRLIEQVNHKYAPRANVINMGLNCSNSVILGSYVIEHRRNGDSLCGSEHYTDSGIEKADSNHLEEEQRFINEDREIKIGKIGQISAQGRH